MRRRPNSISVTPLMPTSVCGITGVDMRFLKAKPIPTRWKETTPSCVTTWRVWQDRRAASRAVPMHLIVPCVCLSTAITGANSISNVTLPIQLTLRISLPHYFSHSHIDKRRLYLFFNAILSWNNSMVSGLIDTIFHPIGFEISAYSPDARCFDPWI
jgi:hypothetical protein